MITKVEYKKNTKRIIVVGCFVVLLLVTALVITQLNRRNQDNLMKNKLDQGEDYISKQDYENAVKIYEELVRDYPDCSQAYLGLIEAYEASGKDDKALAVAVQGNKNTGNKLFDEWRELLYEKKKIIEENNEDEPEEIVVSVKELIECPTICGRSLIEIGGIAGVCELIPDIDIQNENEEYIYNSYEENSLGAYHMTYSKYQGEEMILLLDEWGNASVIGENANEGKVEVDAEYVFDTTPPNYMDGFYNYLKKRNLLVLPESKFSYVDAIIDDLGIESSKIKDEEVFKCMTDIGEAEIRYDRYDISDCHYEFKIKGENEWNIRIFESGDTMGRRTIGISVDTNGY